MNILLDIVHPADVLFFLNPIKRLQELGHDVCVVSRSKDVTEELLNAFAIEHQTISRAGTNLFSLGLELIKRDLALFGIARKFRPDLMCGFGGIAISHVGKLTGIPAISFYDTERAPLQHKITLPFISHLYVPESYQGPIARNRTTRSPWTKELSYLHPENFKPDKAVALAAGLAPQARNFFIRLVSWQANHDIGHAGWQETTLKKFIQYLGDRGKVHLSSELSLSADLEKYRYAGPVRDVHHLLAYCDCYIGESATMASEAAVLGVPAVYATDDTRGYTDELAAANLLWKIPQVSFDALSQAMDLITRLDPVDWSQHVEKYWAEKMNLAEFIVDVILQYGVVDS